MRQVIAPMNATIRDRTRRLFTLKFDLPTDSQYLVVKAFDGKHQIGYAKCIIQGECMLLQDIHISEAVEVREGFVINLIRQLVTRKPKTVNYRGQGIGTSLLLALLQYARDRGLHEVQGYLGPHDWKRNPALPDWYREHGFSVSESGKISFKFQ